MGERDGGGWRGGVQTKEELHKKCHYQLNLNLIKLDVDEFGIEF